MEIQYVDLGSGGGYFTFEFSRILRIMVKFIRFIPRESSEYTGNESKETRMDNMEIVLAKKTDPQSHLR